METGNGCEKSPSLSVSRYSLCISVKPLDLLTSVKSKSSSILLTVRERSFVCLIVIWLIRS